MRIFFKKTALWAALIFIPVFATEFVLGASRASREAQAERSQLTNERCSVFFMDSAEVAALEGIRGQTMTGQRTRASVMRVINQNANTIRRAMRDHTIAGNRVSGGIIVRFKIDAQGNVFECRIVESNTGDIIFEKIVVLEVKKWQFPAIEAENDTTVVEYPFVF